jgi:hypothetical protein
LSGVTPLHKNFSKNSVDLIEDIGFNGVCDGSIIKSESVSDEIASDIKLLLTSNNNEPNGEITLDFLGGDSDPLSDFALSPLKSDPISSTEESILSVIFFG